MIATQFYYGQGLGNQLFCYVASKSLALDKNLEHTTFGNEFFGSPKWNAFGLYFMNFKSEKSKCSLKNFTIIKEKEKRLYLPHSIHDKNLGCDIRGFDQEIKACPSYSLVLGNLQSEKYFYHNKTEIKKWLEISPEFDSYEFSDDNICIINFRGTEYYGNSELFLNKLYWKNAISKMKKINSKMKFVVITEDIFLAKTFFKDFDCFHFDIAKDYISIKNAKYVILSNSSFAFFPVWTSETIDYVIAPKYWSRHNVSNGYWGSFQNIYKGWNYLDREGNIFTYEECIKEIDDEEFIKLNYI
ncbi:hypothetical protein N9P83_01520 [Flavobacteriaceae bacterium]|nr:hypothetical protein [Flavobacteriaceae bacterium]